MSLFAITIIIYNTCTASTAAELLTKVNTVPTHWPQPKGTRHLPLSITRYHTRTSSCRAVSDSWGGQVQGLADGEEELVSVPQPSRLHIPPGRECKDVVVLQCTGLAGVHLVTEALIIKQESEVVLTLVFTQRQKVVRSG